LPATALSPAVLYFFHYAASYFRRFSLRRLRDISLLADSFSWAFAEYFHWLR
jgi:hypothetical protein